HAAHFHGERVRTCILISSGGMALTRNEPQGLINWRKAETEEERRAANRHNLSVMMFGEPENIDDFAVYLQSENTVRARFRNRLLSHRFDNLVPALPHVKAALKGIWGEYDVYAKNHTGERRDYLRSIQPNADVRIVPKAGHWLMYEAAETFNAMLADMLGDGAR
ncbi:MAG: alpha/beta hydrolase, partial [Rhodospirillales bacterium]